MYHEKRLRWRFLNPLDWLKSLYEAFGAKHPAFSFMVVMIVGALVFGALWRGGAQQYEKGRTTMNAPAPLPPAGPISTDAPCSPVTQGSGNTVTTNCEDAAKKAASKTNK